MKIKNPIVKGFYPDPSVCEANGKYYLVCSTMQYFPGVPIFESEDLLNWKQIGHCFTRPEQVALDKITSSSGVFAPTIRFYNGRFYMTTTNNQTHENYYVYTDDIYGEWSDPIYVDQDGIDPSFYFEDGHAYFMSNGHDDDGVGGIVQCEIDIATGKKLSKSKTIWQGSGGRYLEGPHLYKINGRYYLVAAEGGTEFGHMVTYAVSDSIFGEYKGYPKNPVLTNRNLGGYEIQGVGHGDLIQDKNGNWWMIHLAFRQINIWLCYHHLGRETFITPVTFSEDGWFTAGIDGTTRLEFETDRSTGGVQKAGKTLYTFKNTDTKIDWCWLRNPVFENYDLNDERFLLKGSAVTLDMADTPTFIGLRQKDFKADIKANVTLGKGEAGISIYMDENHHYDLAIRSTDSGVETVVKLNVGDIKHIQKAVPVDGNSAKLRIRSDNFNYYFYLGDEYLCQAQTRYVSTEVASGFTGVVIGLYAISQSGDISRFDDFSIEYTPEHDD